MDLFVGVPPGACSALVSASGAKIPRVTRSIARWPPLKKSLVYFTSFARLPFQGGCFSVYQYIMCVSVLHVCRQSVRSHMQDGQMRGCERAHVGVSHALGES